MEDDARRAERNAVFQQLKPVCIELSQLALQINEDIDRHEEAAPQVSAPKLKALLDRLLGILQSRCRDDRLFDDKLANYVFFPLGLIFRRSQRQPAYIIEHALKALNFVLEYGWKQSLTLELAKQILPLLTIIAGGIPGSETAIPEELKLEAYSGLILLFRDLENVYKGPELTKEEATVPVLGQCLFLLTEDIKDSQSPEVQLKALQTVEALWTALKDRELLATFLPGTVSAISKCLTPSVSTHRPRTVLVPGLKVLGLILTSILGDIWTRRLGKKSGSMGSIFTEDWMKATTGQIKLALASIIKLRKHDHELVRQALRSLCVKLLDECNESLKDSATLLVETSIGLWEPEADGGFYTGETRLQDLATIYPSIGEHIKVALYQWIQGLPRVMQVNDDNERTIAIKNLSKGYQLCSTLLNESSVLEMTLKDSLRESVIALLDQSTNRITETDIDSTDINALISTSATRSLTFQPVVISHQSQRETREQLVLFLKDFGSQSFQTAMAGDMLEYLQDGTTNSQLSAFWLCLNLVKAAESKSEEINTFLDFSAEGSDKPDLIREELYSHAVSLISDSDYDAVDWRLQAVALEAITYNAQKLGKEFRADLMDSLYPVVQLLAAPNPQLREHAIISLDAISKSCGYESASELIVQNADYMVNSISLRLNSFDVSPQAPQVLIMMIRLSGAKIIPYLDDVIGSIFAALDNFHGYTKLVEVLFSVLGEVVDEGMRSGQLQITDGQTAPSHRKKAFAGPSIDDIIETIKKLKQSFEPSETLEHEDFPREPWKSAKTLLDEHDAAKAQGEESEEEQEPAETQSSSQEVEKKPPTKTYTLIQDIARLSQHYLTSSSPFLRHRLLDLITTASTALSHNEDAFLPLINDLWPVLLPRLNDPEVHVVLTACETLATFCKTAGDFMSTRIRTAWKEIMMRTKKAKSELDKGRSQRGVYDQRRQVWEALVNLIATIMEYVRVEDAMFDEALEVIGVHVLNQKPEVKAAFDVVNADAVWLNMYLAGLVEVTIAKPQLEGFTFVDVRTTN